MISKSPITNHPFFKKTVFAQYEITESCAPIEGLERLRI